MKHALLTLIAFLFLAIPAFADSPCFTGNPPVANNCIAGNTYAATLGVGDLVVLSNERPGGARTCLQMQASTGNTDRICYAFGAPVDAVNGPCFELKPGDIYYLFNFPQGNSGGQIINTPVHAAARSGNQVLTFLFCR